MIDLHLHTNYSDGSDSPAELIKKLNRKGITHFSITDHDTVKAAEELIPSGLGIYYLPGVEISGEFREQEYHILLYGSKITHPRIKDFCQKNREERAKADEEFVYRVLKAKGIIDNSYEEYTWEPGRGGWKSLNFLKDRKLTDSLDNFFILYDIYGKKAPLIQTDALLEEAISLGLSPVLAHPTGYQKGDLMGKEELHLWKKRGIKGLEVFNSYYRNISNRDVYLNFCHSNNLAVTGGSDYHGDAMERPLTGIKKELLTLTPFQDEFILL